MVAERRKQAFDREGNLGRLAVFPQRNILGLCDHSFIEALTGGSRSFFDRGAVAWCEGATKGKRIDMDVPIAACWAKPTASYRPNRRAVVRYAPRHPTGNMPCRV